MLSLEAVLNGTSVIVTKANLPKTYRDCRAYYYMPLEVRPLHVPQLVHLRPDPELKLRF